MQADIEVTKQELKFEQEDELNVVEVLRLLGSGWNCFRFVSPVAGIVITDTEPAYRAQKHFYM